MMFAAHGGDDAQREVLERRRRAQRLKDASARYRDELKRAIPNYRDDIIKDFHAFFDYLTPPVEPEEDDELYRFLAFNDERMNELILKVLDVEPYDLNALAEICSTPGMLKLSKYPSRLRRTLSDIKFLVEFPLERVSGLMEYILPHNVHRNIFLVLNYSLPGFTMENLRTLTLMWEIMVQADASFHTLTEHERRFTSRMNVDYPITTQYRIMFWGNLPRHGSSPMILFPPIAKALEENFTSRSIRKVRETFRDEAMTILEGKYARAVFAAETSARLRRQKRRRLISFDERCDFADTIFAREDFAHQDTLFVAQLLSPKKELGDLLYKDIVSDLRETLREKISPQALDHMLALY
ncbi:Hypothetical Protein FCC1311_117752 [Hondaea fermentalgiana]|uniref:Uncharacterized protein n=1 Tax=Hondaea fermentalgiana TaxID=2315210 RepID=A0A2R5FDE7_9STRA|nr:Hypothetical Protein FCC1311_117752 [Hondaea fermentalgiana]|eukprot:GBG16300.1 Hypothetical Protein FCC1311_117752 [Hondaea fermentalgiana]